MVFRASLLVGIISVTLGSLCYLFCDAIEIPPEVQITDLPQSLKDWHQRGHYANVGEHQMFYIHEGKGTVLITENKMAYTLTLYFVFFRTRNYHPYPWLPQFELRIQPWPGLPPARWPI